MFRDVFLLALSLFVVFPAVANARTQTKSKLQARLVAKTDESPELTAARDKFFDDKSAEESYANLNKSSRTGGSCYTCHQKGSKKPHNPFGWAAEQLGLKKEYKEKTLTRDQVEQIFKGKDTDEKNELGEHFADASEEALDYWVVLDDSGELKLVKDAKDSDGNPLSFRQRISQGKLPTTDVEGSSYASIFPQDVLDKLNALRADDAK